MATLLRLLTPPIFALSLVLLAVSYIVIGSIVNYVKLRHFKGPPLASFSRFWLFWQEVNARTNIAQFAAIKKYGSVCRIGPNLLVTGDPDIVRHMSAPGSKWSRSAWYEAMKMDPRLDTVFSTRDESLHAELKTKESPGYNGRDIDTLEPDIDSRIFDLINLIKKSYKGVSMDLASVTRFFTLDVLSTVAFGGPFGFLAANEDLWDYNKTSSSFLMVLNLVAHHGWIRWLFFQPWLQAAAGPKDTDKAGIGPVFAVAKRAVAERFGPNAKVKKDMLGSFVAKGLSQSRCEAEAMLQIIAGSDSTTTVFRSTLFLLIGSPPAYAKLRAEIDSAMEGKSSEENIKNAVAQKLPFLSACIWEGMRMFPPLFGLQSKLAPPGGDTIKGIYFPEGTEVALCDDAMCRKPEIFGPDADLFRPDRWIDASEEERAKFRRTVDSIFGTGRYTCLGRHIALMELHKAVAELIRHFDWAMADPMRGIDTYAHGVHIQSNMNVIATPR